jgi:hypothetical protein
VNFCESRGLEANAAEEIRSFDHFPVLLAEEDVAAPAMRACGRGRQGPAASGEQHRSPGTRRNAGHGYPRSGRWWRFRTTLGRGRSSSHRPEFGEEHQWRDGLAARYGDARAPGMEPAPGAGHAAEGRGCAGFAEGTDC